MAITTEKYSTGVSTITLHELGEEKAMVRFLTSRTLLFITDNQSAIAVYLYLRYNITETHAVSVYEIDQQFRYVRIYCRRVYEYQEHTTGYTI